MIYIDSLTKSNSYNTNLDDLPTFFKSMFHEIIDIIFYGLQSIIPSTMIIRHHIHHIIGTILINKLACKMNTQQNEEIQ